MSNRDPSYEFGNGRRFIEPINRVWNEGGVAPSSTFAPVITGADYDGSTLTCTTGSWSARPDPTYNYQWKSGATNVGTDQNTYVSQVSDIGYAITCAVTATNYEGSSSRESNAITVTASASPSNTVAPVVSGSQPAGSTLSSTNGTWAANPAVSSYSYQWRADAGNVGINQATYVTQVGDVGKSITCTVTATNVKGSGQQASNGVTVTAALASPANTVAPAISGDAPAGSTLTSTTGTWTGNPTPTYGYQWKSDGANVGSNQNTYVTQEGDVGKSVTCTVTATNSQGNSSQASNGITVTESDPDAVITALFANSEQGAWYDPSDLTTMFQDRAGTTSVTADGQTVGKILDKSGRGNHLVAPNDSSRPLYKTDGTYHWLQCDGVDDTLSTPSSVTTGNTHKVSMWLGATRTSTNDAIVAQISDDQYCSSGFGIQAGTKNDGIYQAWSGRVRPDSSANEVYFYSDNVVVNQKQTASMFINTDLATYTDQVKFNLNNAAKTLIGAGPSAMSATGLSAYPLYIAGALGSYIGPVKLYSLIILMRESTTQERSDTEAWVNGKTGAY